MQKLKKGDKVQILKGKDRGKTANIEKLDFKDGLVWLPGINMYKRHLKSRQGIEGGIMEMIKPLKISNVGVFCTVCKRSTRVGFKIVDGKTSKVRVCRRCEKEL